MPAQVGTQSKVQTQCVHQGHEALHNMAPAETDDWYQSWFQHVQMIQQHKWLQMMADTAW